MSRIEALTELRALILRYGSGEWPDAIPVTVFKRVVELTVILVEIDREALYKPSRN